jgi:hypothetical protein
MKCLQLSTNSITCVLFLLTTQDIVNKLLVFDILRKHLYFLFTVYSMEKTKHTGMLTFGLENAIIIREF